MSGHALGYIDIPTLLHTHTHRHSPTPLHTSPFTHTLRHSPILSHTLTHTLWHTRFCTPLSYPLICPQIYTHLHVHSCTHLHNSHTHTRSCILHRQQTILSDSHMLWGHLRPPLPAAPESKEARASVSLGCVCVCSSCLHTCVQER